MINRIFAIAVLVVSGLFFYESRLFAERKEVQTFSSAFFPRLILYLMIVLSIILLIQSFIRKSKHISLSSILDFLRKRWRVPVMFVWLSVYLTVMPVFGFLYSTIAFLLVSFYLLSRITLTSMIAYIPLSVTLTFAIQFIFEHELKIILP